MNNLSKIVNKLVMFSSKKYDQEYFEKNLQLNNMNLKITYIQEQLNENTYIMAKDHSIVCVFVNDKLNSDILVKLSELGISMIALRCAGFNNIDLEKAKILKCAPHSNLF